MNSIFSVLSRNKDKLFLGFSFGTFNLGLKMYNDINTIKNNHLFHIEHDINSIKKDITRTEKDINKIESNINKIENKINIIENDIKEININILKLLKK